MIHGIGCDICAIERMEKILQKPNAPHFLQRVFAPSELELFGLAKWAEAALQDATPVLQNSTPPWQDAASVAPSIPQKTAERLAANFAAKEAFLKATGLGLAGFALADIAALRRESGAPYYVFTGSAADYMAQHSLTAHLSLSHEKGSAGMALAYCVLEVRNPL